MIEVLAGFVIFGVVVTLMALGVLAGRPAIRGSCGGLARITGHDEDDECMMGCERPCARREARERKKREQK